MTKIGPCWPRLAWETTCTSRVAGVEGDDHLVQPADSAQPLRHQPRGETAVAVPRDRQLDVADLGRHRLRGSAVARVRKQRRVRVAPFVADVVGQLDLQATFQGGLQHDLQQAVIASERDRAGIDLGEDRIQGARSLQPLGQLTLPLTTLGVIRIHHSHSSVLSK